MGHTLRHEPPRVRKAAAREMAKFFKPKPQMAERRSQKTMVFDAVCVFFVLLGLEPERIFDRPKNTAPNFTGMDRPFPDVKRSEVFGRARSFRAFEKVV